MVDVEIKSTTQLTREQAGERLIVLGKALAGGSSAKVEYDGSAIRFAVPGDLSWEFELEVEGDEVELEIELKWPIASASAASVPTPTPTAAAAGKRAKGTSSTRGSKGARRGGGRRPSSG
jgi:amphi-Trp domain-containing protein